MKSLLNQSFYNKLSYPVQELSKEIIKYKIDMQRKNITKNFLYLSIIIIAFIYYWINRTNASSIILVPLFTLLGITFIGKIFSIDNKKYNNMINSIKAHMETNLCNCSFKCTCQDSYIKFMKETYGIKLY